MSLQANILVKPSIATLASGKVIQPGQCVRVVPRRQADAVDTLLAGRRAIVESIEQDFEGRTLVTVSFVDDPGRDLGASGRPGHRFFYHLDELELIDSDPGVPNPAQTASPNDKPVLVAGIGNIFLGDDAFGVEVIRRLQHDPPQDRVHLLDVGIRVFDLAFALQDNYSAAILIDTVHRGEAPGTVYVLDPTPTEAEPLAPFPQGHAALPHEAIRWALTAGSVLPQLRLVGCEPSSFEPGNISQPVEDAIEPVMQIVRRLIASFLTIST